MKRLAKILLCIIISPLLLCLLLGVLIYIPPVQDAVVHYVCDVASEQTGLMISVRQVGLSFPLDLDVRDAVAIDQQGDTLMDVRQVIVDLDFSRVLDWQIGLDELALRCGRVNTKELIDGVTVSGRLGSLLVAAPHGIDLTHNKVTLHDIALNDCDLSVFVGEIPKDTTESVPLPWLIDIAHARLSDVHAYVSLDDSMTIEARMGETLADDIALSLADSRYSLRRLVLAMDSLSVDSRSLPSFTATIDTAAIDTVHIGVRHAMLQSSQTWLAASLDMDVKSLTGDDEDALFDATVSGYMGNADLDSLCRRYDLDLMRLNRDADLSLQMQAHGNLSRIEMPHAALVWDKVLSLDMSATADHPLDSTLRADVQADLRSFVGNASLAARYDNISQAYDALLDLYSLSPHSIMRSIPIRSLSGRARINGQGDGFRASATLDCHDSLVNASAQLDAVRRVSRHAPVEATIGLDMRRIDLHGLHLVDSVLSVGGCLHMDATTNLSDSHRLNGTLNDIVLIRPDTVLRPVDLTMDVMVRPDSLYAMLTAGQMYMSASTRGGIDKVQRQIDAFVKEFQTQSEKHFIEQEVMRPLLPTADIHMHVCGRNPVSTYLGMMGYTFDDMRFDLNSNPETGLNGGGHIMSLNTGAIQLDTIRWDIFQDSTGVNLKSQIHNGPENKQFVFDARCDMYIVGDGAGISLTYTDGKGKRGVDLGAVATLTERGVKLHLTPLKPIIAYRHFTLNPDNYAFLSLNGSVLADIDLLADDGTGVQLYSELQMADTIALDSLAAGYQDITASFNHVNLGELSSVLPYLPVFSGLLEGDVHYMQQDGNKSVAMDARIDRFVYEGAPIGSVGLNAVYLPGDDDEHLIDGTMSLDNTECAAFSGMYLSHEADRRIDINADLERFPLRIVNGFVDSGLAQVSGSIDGNLHIDGTLDDPRVNGAFMTSAVNVVSTDYSLNLRLVDDTVRIVDNYLDFDRIDVYSTGRNPLTMDGWVDFRNLQSIALDLSFRGKDFELINAKKNTRALAYGKVYCDVDAYVRGTLNRLKMGGTLNVLGNTNVTYVLRDSPLTVEDRLNDIVTFVDFSHEDAEVEEQQLSRMDIDVNMKVVIDEAAQVHCLLSPDRSSYIDIEGGGELTMTYTPATELMLNGQYTINSGEMKYQLPVIPLKTFKLERGSYVAFNGKILNPTLNITATERTRAQVSEDGRVNRTVLFDVGVRITQTLENLGLQFTIDAPEDATVQGDLDTMDDATRGRLAVTMLATGMYLSENNNSSGGFSTENALNSFLQSEINNIAGKALSSVDLTFGMENTTTATGATQTDYSFRFAKHFWGNRISVVLGGTVSSGSEAQNDGTTLVDNVSIEYRLDKSATRYVRVFYDKAYESLIDGKITEMGTGLVLRRKTTRLGDLFIFRKKKE